MELPNGLRSGVEELVAGVPLVRLERAAQNLSGRYRAARPTPSPPPLRSADDVVAYAAVRLPATYAAAYASLAQTAAALPGWQPRSVLDAGAGPGTAAWAASALWPSLRAVTLLERDAHMIAVGRRLAGAGAPDSLRSAQWVQGDVASRHTLPGGGHDLVLMAYALGEIAADSRARTIERLWAATLGVLVVIEPGTPDGFGRIRDARARMIDLGAHVAAPCPHGASCPMAGKNWCHFAERVSRSHLHRVAKGATLSFEDEKFSFVSLARVAPKPAPARVLRHPQVRSGHVRLVLCGPVGLSETTVTRKEGARYRAVRSLRWGSSLPWPPSRPGPQAGHGEGADP